MSETADKKVEANAAEELKKACEASQCECGCGCAGEECACAEEKKEGCAEAELAAAKAKADEYYDQYVRTVAEMENVRRRCAEDVQKAQKFGVEKFAQNLLPVIDSLDKALEITAGTEGAMREGLLATHRQMLHALEMSGMTVIDPKGEKFDPNKHQAIAMVPAGEGQVPGSVAVVFQRGWMIYERVLRPAMVSVVQG